MRFRETRLPGVYIIQPEHIADARGSFARTFCAAEFTRHGLHPGYVQCNTSFNLRRGILRGLHYQADPHWEVKLVRCTRGAVYDVVADLRPDSPAFLQWVGIELTADAGTAVYVPKGCVHGYQCLADGSEVFYQMSEPFRPEASRGIRWNDPAIGVSWPIPEPFISERDRNFPLVDVAETLRSGWIMYRPEESK